MALFQNNSRTKTRSCTFFKLPNPVHRNLENYQHLTPKSIFYHASATTARTLTTCFRHHTTKSKCSSTKASFSSPRNKLQSSPKKANCRLLSLYLQPRILHPFESTMFSSFIPVCYVPSSAHLRQLRRRRRSLAKDMANVPELTPRFALANFSFLCGFRGPIGRWGWRWPIPTGSGDRVAVLSVSFSLM
jgi:hypothetical protein